MHPVIDAHVHVNRFDLMKPAVFDVIKTNPTFGLMQKFVADPDAFLAHLDAEGIEQAWLINYSARDTIGYGREVNEWVAEYVQADPARLIAVGGYDPHHDGDGVEAADTLRDAGIMALKIHTVHQHLQANAHRGDTEAAQRLRACYGRLEELAMPVIFHTGTSVFPGADNAFADPAPVGDVLADFPDLPVIIAHGGRPNQTATALALLAQYPNAWLDVSSCPPQRLPAYFGDMEALAPRTLWGSDWPGPKVPGMGANVQAFLQLGLSAGANEQILFRNAAGLLDRVV